MYYLKTRKLAVISVKIYVQKVKFYIRIRHRLHGHPKGGLGLDCVGAMLHTTIILRLYGLGNERVGDRRAVEIPG